MPSCWWLCAVVTSMPQYVMSVFCEGLVPYSSPYRQGGGQAGHSCCTKVEKRALEKFGTTALDSQKVPLGHKQTARNEWSAYTSPQIAHDIQSFSRHEKSLQVSKAAYGMGMVTTQYRKRTPELPIEEQRSHKMNVSLQPSNLTCLW